MSLTITTSSQFVKVSLALLAAQSLKRGNHQTVHCVATAGSCAREETNRQAHCVQVRLILHLQGLCSGSHYTDAASQLRAYVLPPVHCTYAASMAWKDCKRTVNIGKYHATAAVLFRGPGSCS